MTKTKSTKHALIMSVMALFLCFTMLLGTTFAWFTDSATSGSNVIAAGNLDIELEYSTDMVNWTAVDANTNIFKEGALWEPGYTEVVYLRVSNLGNLALKYKLGIEVADETAGKTKDNVEFKLSDYIEYGVAKDVTAKYADRAAARAAITTAAKLNTAYSEEFHLVGKTATATDTDVYALVVYMPESVGNEVNHNGTDIPEIKLGLSVLATQDTVEGDSFDNQYDKDSTYPELATADVWDGTADTSWYDPENPKTEYTFTTVEQLAGLSELCSGDTTFTGVTFTLANDLDLYCEDTSENADGDPVTFRPIGDHSKDGTFEGTFDGAGHTITNLYQNGWDLGYQWGVYGSYGLFGNVNNATIKNLTISGSESYIEGGDTSFVAGSATGTCVFEDITIEDSTSATYNNGNGGIIGWSGAGNYTFKNITIKEDCVLAGLWGSFDSSIGGIVGQAEPGATYNFENVNVACRIDAYNDCTASYDYYNYRMCGMLIGRCEETTTIGGTNYPDMSKYNVTFTNVTVNYGDWMNYHYCDPTPGYNNGRGMRVEPGYSYDGLPADYDHSQCTAHHNECIPFNQIIGGDQYGVKGLPSYEGVTVNYPASYNP